VLGWHKNTRKKVKESRSTQNNKKEQGEEAPQKKS
jgi:hypothetical protein